MGNRRNNGNIRGRNHRRTRSRRKSRVKTGMIAMLVVVLAIGIVFASKTADMRKQLENLEKAEASLQDELDKQYQRSITLEEQRIYIKTKKYVEERAREMGLVYPDEILFVPKD